MDITIKAAVLSLALGIPALSYAQTSNGPVTRAQVRAELRALERAGYEPGRADDATYPQDIQAAEARVAMQRTAQRSATDEGGAASGTTRSGHAVRSVTGTNTRYRSMFGHH
jgi:hypothetical protein